MYMYKHRWNCLSLHVAHMSGSLHFEWVVSHIWMSEFHITHMTEWVLYHTHDWVSASHVARIMSHKWMSGCWSSCHIHENVSASPCCEWVMSHIRMSKLHGMYFRYVPATEWSSSDEMTPTWTFLLQRVAACCSVLQRVAAYCSVLQRGAACCSVLQRVAVFCSVLQRVPACCSVLQRVAAILGEGAESRWLPRYFVSTHC